MTIFWGGEREGRCDSCLEKWESCCRGHWGGVKHMCTLCVLCMCVQFFFFPLTFFVCSVNSFFLRDNFSSCVDSFPFSSSSRLSLMLLLLLLQHLFSRGKEREIFTGGYFCPPVWTSPFCSKSKNYWLLRLLSTHLPIRRGSQKISYFLMGSGDKKGRWRESYMCILSLLTDFFLAAQCCQIFWLK